MLYTLIIHWWINKQSLPSGVYNPAWETESVSKLKLWRALWSNRAGRKSRGQGKGRINLLRTVSGGLPKEMTVKTEQWEGVSRAKDRQKAAPRKGYSNEKANSKEAGMCKGLKIGQCAWSTVSKGNTVADEVGKGKGRGCEGPFKAMIRSLDFVRNSVCSGRPLQGFI